MYLERHFGINSVDHWKRHLLRKGNMPCFQHLWSKQMLGIWENESCSLRFSFGTCLILEIMTCIDSSISKFLIPQEWRNLRTQLCTPRLKYIYISHTFNPRTGEVETVGSSRHDQGKQALLNSMRDLLSKQRLTAPKKGHSRQLSDHMHTPVIKDGCLWVQTNTK